MQNENYKSDWNKTFLQTEEKTEMEGGEEEIGEIEK